MSPLLEVKAAHTYIAQYHILQGVSLDVEPGEILALLGRNGAGKTTTLKTIMGLTPPRSGEVVFDGEELQGRPTYDIAALGVGYAPEHRAVFRDLSVKENLLLAERSKGDFERRSELIFGLFPDLKRLIKLSGAGLSGGQQQMLTLARAMTADNRLLLIDEPTEGLAPVIVEQMVDAVRRLADTAAIVLVEQNFSVAAELARRYVIVEQGASVKSGDMADLVDDEETIRRYLGAA